MLPDRLQALLVRFYSKNVAADKAEIAQLGTLDWSKLVMLNNVSSESAVDSGVVAPGNGVLFSMIEKDTIYNGISRASGDWCSIVNFGTQVGANSCVAAVVAKGDAVDVHNNSAQTSTRKWYFVPFLGGGVSRFLRRILREGLPCLTIASKPFSASPARWLTRPGQSGTRAQKIESLRPTSRLSTASAFLASGARGCGRLLTIKSFFRSNERTPSRPETSRSRRATTWSSILGAQALRRGGASTSSRSKTPILELFGLTGKEVCHGL